MTAPPGLGGWPFRGPLSHHRDILEKSVDRIEWQSCVGYRVGLESPLGFTQGCEEEGVLGVCLGVFAVIQETPLSCV